jgi:flagellar basal-body rod protein FlgB
LPLGIISKRVPVRSSDEMLKAADNQGDYQLASLLYRKSLQTLRTAVGR